MNKKPVKTDAEVEAEIEALLNAAKPISAIDLAGLKASGEEWENDPAEQADYHKALFVTAISEAMKARGWTQNALAKKWGRSRQYLSKLLNQDRRTNFTIETMVELTILLGIGFRIDTAKPAEAKNVGADIPQKAESAFGENKCSPARPKRVQFPSGVQRQSGWAA